MRQATSRQTGDYTGRFAPSPSGALHFGSLVAALGSYLQARWHNGRWLLRIEDIDPPREVPGADQLILRQLAHYGLQWDGEVLYQSRRSQAYSDALDWLWQQGLSYYCDCHRQRVRSLGGLYDGYCRLRHLSPDVLAAGLRVMPGQSVQYSSGQYQPAKRLALRLLQRHAVSQFYDAVHGWITVDPALAGEDFIIRRRDGLFAYNLAVVVDDHLQNVSEVVRGADLLIPTVRQISLYHTFGWSVPAFCHLPLALDASGNKLSKQNHAPPLPAGDPRPVLIQALQFLHQPLPESWQDLSLEQLLAYAVAHWQVARLRDRQG